MPGSQIPESFIECGSFNLVAGMFTASLLPTFLGRDVLDVPQTGDRLGAE